MVYRGCILPSVGVVQRRWRIYRQKPIGRVIAAFAGVTGGRWIDRIPPRCHRAKMRGGAAPCACLMVLDLAAV